MKFLKGLALAILSFLLFLSLSVFGLVLTLNQTILNPDFVVSQVDRLDIPSLAGEMISQQMPQEQEFIAGVASDTIADLEPWIKEQVTTGIYSFYDYLEGRSENLSLIISLEPAKEKFKDNLWQAASQSPPPELAGLPPAEIERELNEFYSEFSEQIPSTFELDEASLDPQVMAQLEQAKQIVGYLHLAYNALIGLILLLILGIVLINRQVKGTTRQLGSAFLSAGAASYIGVFVAKQFAGTQLTQLDMPVYLQMLAPQFVTDTLAPLEMYGIGLLVAGVALLVVSFVHKQHQPSL